MEVYVTYLITYPGTVPLHSASSSNLLFGPAWKCMRKVSTLIEVLSLLPEMETVSSAISRAHTHLLMLMDGKERHCLPYSI